MNQCGLCEQGIEDGELCLGCVKETVVRLECWPDLYDGLAAFLAPAVSGSQGRGSKPVYAPLPVSEDILDLRGPGGLVGVAERWVDDIRDKRGMPELEPREGAIEVRLRAAVATLLGHLPWVAVSWPDAGRFAEDIRDVTRSVSSIVRPEEPAPRGMRLGNCPANFGDGWTCGAALVYLPGEREVTCRWCGQVYPSKIWYALKAVIARDEADAAAEMAEASGAG